MVDTVAAAVAAPAAPAVAAPAAPAAAAPAAAPAAPAAAPAPVLVAPDAGASVLDVAAPVAPAAAAAAAPVAPTLAEAQRIVEAARLAAQPNSGAGWNLNDTTPGIGEKPAWFKSDKYANVARQAEAYVALESRFGAFQGAPKDGKYTVPRVEVDGKQIDAVPYKDPTTGQEYNIHLDLAHPQLQAFDKWAAEHQLSQDGYNSLLGMMAMYEASQEPDINAAKAALGPNADARIGTVVNWAKANLDANGFQLMRAVTAGHEAAPAFALLEAMIAKTGTVRMPAPGDDVPGGTQAGGLAAIQAKQAAKNAKGERLYEINPQYRKDVDAEYKAFFDSNPVQRDRQGNLRG